MLTGNPLFRLWSTVLINIPMSLPDVLSSVYDLPLPE